MEKEITIEYSLARLQVRPGHLGHGHRQILASNESAPNKAVLGATVAMNFAAPLMMLKQKDDFKPEQLAANGAFVAGLRALAFKAYNDAK